MAKSDFRLQFLNRDMCAIDGRECGGICKDNHHKNGHCTALYHITSHVKRDGEVILNEVEGAVCDSSV